MPKTYPPSLTKTQVRAILKKYGNDGHTLWDPEGFLKIGIPKEIVDRWTHVEKSDGTPKGTIISNGRIVKELKSIYGLSMLRSLADMVKADTSKCDAIGRGTEACQLTKAILQAIED